MDSRGYETRSFEKDLELMEAFKDWLRETHYRSVAMESTCVYWIPLYATLEGEFNVSLANAQRTRKVSGRKTDQLNSVARLPPKEWPDRCLLRPRTGCLSPP